MTPKKYDHTPRTATNKILASLTISCCEQLKTLEPVALQAGTVLYEPDEAVEHVYFLTNALVSIVAMNTEGSAIEIGLIGCEGMVGVPAFLGGVSPYGAVVQMAGNAFRMRGQRLYEEFRKSPFLRDLLLKYTNVLLIQIAQSSICNCYHTLQERLCRWLLIARDATRSDILLLTHEVIAQLLGTRRASVTVNVGLLQRAGLIKVGRRQITILNPSGLEKLACECYGVVRDGIRRLQAS